MATCFDLLKAKKVRVYLEEENVVVTKIHVPIIENSNSYLY
jgi:hypothetical protein